MPFHRCLEKKIQDRIQMTILRDMSTPNRANITTKFLPKSRQNLKQKSPTELRKFPRQDLKRKISRPYDSSEWPCTSRKGWTMRKATQNAFVWWPRETRNGIVRLAPSIPTTFRHCALARILGQRSLQDSAINCKGNYTAW